MSHEPKVKIRGQEKLIKSYTSTYPWLFLVFRRHPEDELMVKIIVSTKQKKYEVGI